MRLETIATDLQKQIGGGRVMISEMGHTQKCTPSIACAQNVKASVKGQTRSDWSQMGGAFLEMKTT